MPRRPTRRPAKKTARRAPRRRNPSGDHSTNETVVEYAVLQLFKKMSVEKAAQTTAERLSGNRNILISGNDVVRIDPKVLEEALWLRIVKHMMKGVQTVKSGREDVAFEDTAYHFRLNTRDQRTLHLTLESILGRPVTVRPVPARPTPLPRRNPARRRATVRRRNPASKARTYAEARADILRALRAEGWDVRENLKVPHATHPSGDFRLWFKTQAIYFTTGDRRRGQGSLANAYSLHMGDIRAISTATAMAQLDHARRMETGR